MEIQELQQQIALLKEKLERAERRLAALREKGKYLEMQYKDAREREKQTGEIIAELLERQRELNVMLNRANIMLNRTQEVMALTSMELNEMAKALPEPKKAEWAERVARINELFKKTGVQDAEMLALESNTFPAESGHKSADEHDNSPKFGNPQKEFEEAANKKQSIWERIYRREPPRVEAFPVDDTEPEPATESGQSDSSRAENSAEQSDDNPLTFPPRRKSWWRRAAG
ncbi:MAG: DUF3450 domain-containing protein [Armatimonadetes bacterium]|nr:DUF3450 domain-containing protein [Armatimonadota bacterium]